MTERNGRKYEEIQLDFAFVSETALTHSGTLSEIGEPPAPVRHPVRARGVAKTLAAAHAVLLEAPLEELNTHLGEILEFCEAALTRALDVVPQREGALFSSEEDRSLRGIGQAQWLLTEASAKRERQAENGRVQRAPKKQKAKARKQHTD